jgi:hypothetical protein
MWDVMASVLTRWFQVNINLASAPAAPLRQFRHLLLFVEEFWSIISSHLILDIHS